MSSLRAVAKAVKAQVLQRAKSTAVVEKAVPKSDKSVSWSPGSRLSSPTGTATAIQEATGKRVRVTSFTLDKAAEHLHGNARATLFEGNGAQLVEALRQSGPMSMPRGGTRRLVPVELDGRSLSTNPESQLKQLVKQLRMQGCEVPSPMPGEGLWAYLRRRRDPSRPEFTEMWSKDNHPVSPTIVIRNAQQLFGGSMDRAFEVVDTAMDRVRSGARLGARDQLDMLRPLPHQVVFAIEKPMNATQAKGFASLRTGLADVSVVR